MTHRRIQLHRVRGLTLIEVLVSLALLSGLMLAVVSWTQASTRTAAQLSGPIAWGAAADRMLDLIEQELLIGDFAPSHDNGNADSNDDRRVRAAINDGHLIITTRSAIGPASHRYEFDRIHQQLRLGEESSQHDGTVTHRLLLEQIGDFQCEIDDSKKWLTVMIVSSDNRQRASRRYRIDT